MQQQHTDLIKRVQYDLVRAKARADYISTAFPGTAITVMAQNRVNALRRMLHKVTSQAAKNP